jgi:hypothetical protein
MVYDVPFLQREQERRGDVGETSEECYVCRVRVGWIDQRCCDAFASARVERNVTTVE